MIIYMDKMRKFIKRLSNLFNKEMRAYNRLHRKHHNELIKLVKEDAEWDWEYLHTLIITKIRHMYEYYTAGNNVWQTDETLLPIIEELKHILDLQKELDGLYDKYDPHIEMEFDDDNKIKLKSDDNAIELFEKHAQEEDKLYKEIYQNIGEHLREWWD